MGDPLKVFADLTTNATLVINDPAVLDLDRGEACIGKPFENQDALLKHLAINLVGQDIPLRCLDGWADLPDNAVTVRTYDMDVELSTDG
jgi:hypothetical protein